MSSYIVKEGDTLNNIATAFGTTVEDIAAANNIQNVNLIYAGDELNINIPQAQAPVNTAPAATNNGVGEVDLSEFAEPAAPAEALPLAQPAPAPQPQAEPLTYTIKDGDTLGDIAARNGTTVEELARLNNIADVNRIYTGNVLVIKPATEAMQQAAQTEVAATATTSTEVQAAPEVLVEPTPAPAPVAQAEVQTEVTPGTEARDMNATLAPTVNIGAGSLQGVYTGNVLNKMNASSQCRADSGVLTFNNKVYSVGANTAGNTLSQEDYLYLVGQVAGESGLDCDDMMGVCTTILNRLERGGFGSSVKGVLQVGYWPWGKTCDKYVSYEGTGSPKRLKTEAELGSAEYAKLQRCINVVQDAMNGVRNLNSQTLYYFGDGQRNHFSDFV